MIKISFVWGSGSFLYADGEALHKNKIKIRGIFDCSDDINNIIKLLRKINSSILFLDMPLNANYEWFEKIEKLLAACPSIKIIVTTTEYENKAVERVLQMSLKGYWYRNITNPTETFIQCVQKVCKGEQYITNEI